ncbi:MAG: EAL domain-containing protein [Betaproteobacteria bacterium]|nr:EAL domain-containing protein [Betaproteobacteria bacterium]
MVCESSHDEADAVLTGWENPAARLRQALDYDHFCLYAQPIHALAAPGGIALAEVLVRLSEEETRMLPPGDFLPAFEHYGMMAELDRWVLRNALRRLEQGGEVAKLSLNLSAQAIGEPGFVPFLAMQLRITAVDPAALVFELDENDALDRRVACERFASDVKKLGCGVLLDGFARRSVSFAPLKSLLADYVKVDGTIIRPLLSSGAAQAKLKAIVRVGQVTGAKVIAECVEEETVKAKLAELGVAFMQGFGVAKPQTIDHLFGARSLGGSFLSARAPAVGA